MNSPTQYPQCHIAAFRPFGALLLVAVFLVTPFSQLNALEIQAFKDLKQLSDGETSGEAQRLRERISDMENLHRSEMGRLEARIEELEIVIRRLQQAAQIQLQREEQLAFEQRRSENWARVTNGMQRQDVYRLLGRGIKDTKSILDCRCYTRGRICFNENDQSIKSELRCEL